MAKFCSKCKGENPDYSKFCAHCGSPFEPEPDLKEETESPWKNQTPAEDDLSLSGATIAPTGPVLPATE
ncbi:MAG: hypothetical protein D6785_13210, partial [Planctomycetota bacterium]